MEIDALEQGLSKRVDELCDIGSDEEDCDDNEMTALNLTDGGKEDDWEEGERGDEDEVES